MPEIQPDFGTKIEYDPLWKGPIEVRRTAKDKPWLIVFGIFLAAWIGVSIYAYCSGDIKNINLKDVNNDITRFSESNSDANAITIKNIAAAKMIVLGFSVLAIVLSLGYTILLRWHAKIMVYTALFVICALLLAATIAAGYIYAKNKDNTNSLVLLIVCAITFVIVVICTIVYRKKIDVACEVIRESSKAVMFFPSTLVFPILPYILSIVMTGYALSVFGYLAAIPKPNEDTPAHLYVCHFINLFGYLWAGCFVVGFAQMTLSGTFATWYWTMNKHYIPNAVVISFMGTVTRYHLGTIAFGSLILAICQLINLILEAMKSQVRDSRNALACLIHGCYQCIFQNLERFIKFINRNAYIMSAVHGTGFFRSARDAFNLLMRNLVKVIVINKVTDAILFLGQLVVVGLSVLCTYAYCHNNSLDQIQSSAMLMVLIISSLVTVAFFMTLKTAIDTIFLCVLEDIERNDGSDEKPYYMSFKLRNALLQ